MSSSNVVWAKMRYCSYWPAKIIDRPPPGISKQPKKCCVFFFGTRNYGLVELQNVLSYVQHRPRLSSKGRGKYFREAVIECDEFILNPINSCQNETREEVVVKTELDFEMKVKQENQFDVMCASEVVKVSSNVQASSFVENTCKICDIKDGEIIALKSQNENLVREKDFDQSNNDSQIKTLQVENEKLHREIAQLSNKSRFMETQHSVDVERISAFKKQVNFLENENEKLKSKLDGEYEVEKILKHTKKGHKMRYLIRWKGFSPDHDTWQEENDLNCPDILDAYHKSKKM